jgi:heptosyltransferase-3
VKTNFREPGKPGFLVFRNGDIGNTLVATPFLRNLKESYPASRVSVVVDAIGLSVLKNNPFIDDFTVFERHSDGLKRQMQLVRKWRRGRYDVSFHLRTGVRNELLAFLSGIPSRIGFRLKGSFQFLTRKVRQEEIQGHVIDKSLSLLEKMTGVKPRFYFPELFQDREDADAVDRFLRENRIEGKRVAVVHPTGRSIGTRNWNFAFYRDLLAKLSRNRDIVFVLIGAAHEAPVIREAFAGAGNAVFGMHLELQQKSELIRRAALFIGNDSGPAHIAEAWSVPKVVFYRDDPRNYADWHPVREGLYLTVFHREIPLDGTYEKIEDFVKRHYDGSDRSPRDGGFTQMREEANVKKRKSR